MNRIFRLLLLVLAGFAVALSGCSPAVTPAANPPPQVQNQPVVLPSSPPEVIQEAPVPEPAPAAADSPASFDGLVWEDLDRDGIQDLQEIGIQGVTVNLLDSARVMLGTTLTNENGAYQFKDLVAGDYFVHLQLPPGFVFSPQDQGVNELVDSDVNPNTTETIPVPLLPGENGLVFTTGIYSPTTTVLPDSGTVKPPPPEISVCVAGNYPLGGVSAMLVGQLAPGYCLHAYLWNHAFAIGRIPGGAGRILTDVTFVEYFYQGSFVYEAPSPANTVQVCFSVPANTLQVQIYFFDHYGPRFGKPHQGQPSWVPLETTIQGSTACAVAQTSGAYALIGK